MTKHGKPGDSGGAGIDPHPLVSEVVTDANYPPRLRVIRGYVGKSSQDDTVRVYLDVELRRFVDVPSNEIVHLERPSKRGHALAPDLLWVGEEAKIRHRGSWAASEDPTTMATGEEGDGDPTTMATGEESAGFQDPLEFVVNPFGRY